MLSSKLLNLLHFESDSKIWDYRDDKGFPLYLMVRYRLLQGMINKRFSLSNPHLPLSQPLVAVLKYLIKSLVNSPLFIKKKKILIFSSGVVSVKGNDGIFYNRLYQNFVDQYPDEVGLIEASNKRAYSKPKKTKVFYRDLLDIFIFIYSHFKKPSHIECQTVNDFKDYLSAGRQSDLGADFNKVVLKQISKYRAGYSLYRLFFSLKKPKLVLVEDASYGGYAYIVKAAQDLGIKVAEYQHGYIGLNHPAYNFNLDNLPNDIYGFFPSIFLTHGEHWVKNCKVPAEKIAVGYPDLLNRIKIYGDKSFPKESNSILFISGGTIPEKLSSFIGDFISLNPGSKVYLRPHPSERPEVKKRYDSLINKGVIIDVGDLYTVLSASDVVVSFSVSTVLYEAIFFTKKIYLVDDDYANFYEPNSPFLRFDTPESLTDQIQSEAKIDITPDYFWANNPEQRFNDFLQTVLKDSK